MGVRLPQSLADGLRPGHGRAVGRGRRSSEVEEIDVVEPGGNYGWNRIEGDRCYPSGGQCDVADTMPPVATYRHDEGCSVSGGFVYRGEGVPSLYGSYVYGDFCSGRIWALPPISARARW